MKVTETNEFRMEIADELLAKAQETLSLVSCELETSETREEIDSVIETLRKVILIIRDCQ